MTGFAEQLSRYPIAVDSARADGVLAALDTSLSMGPMRDLLHGAAGSSPYLARLIERHGSWLTEIRNAPPLQTMDGLCTDLEGIVATTSRAGLGEALRVTKSRAALLTALADLGGVWDVGAVTGALTRLADTTVTVTSKWLLSRAIVAGKLPGLVPEDVETGAGYVVLAMGKMGAAELNYSSDIDLIVLFDDSRFTEDTVLDARAEYVRITRDLVKLLSENTAHGYVFRTDLRLRPSPSTTPVCMAISAAERYYETAGRTWERAAHIKARPLVDIAAGELYLETLRPFIWRRHLDFAAIEDVQDLLRMIRKQNAQFTVSSMPGHDLKLGPGGIREIEFFAQTRQLITGGRDPSLRERTTQGALAALAKAGWIDADIRDRLSGHYKYLRGVEHRIQMIEDAQTHKVPKSEDGRQRLAALCGEQDSAQFESTLAARLADVHQTCEALYTGGQKAEEDAAAGDGNSFGAFERPEDAERTISRWRDGGIAATRTERAQALFQRIEPQITARLSRASRPDQALAHFDRFISGLPAGVQVFSLFAANPRLLDLTVQICAAAPRLGGYLARHPQTLDAFVAQDFWQPLPGLEEMEAGLATRLADLGDYEGVLNETRRWSREHWFRAGVHVLQGVAGHVEAGAAFSRIAELCVRRLLPHVTADFATRHGPPPGEGMVVLAMGKLGTREMSAGSDLDLITIYSDGDVDSDGPRPLPPRTYYPRLTQALIAALTAQTAEGALYEVDMRLRPSGRSGPVSVSLSAFERYQAEEAWVWEHMALTRARAIAGPASLAGKVEAVAAAALEARIGSEKVIPEAREMRGRLIDANSRLRDNPWSLKHARGGLMEMEFLSQALGLLHGAPHAVPAAEVFDHLAGRDVLDTETLQVLTDGLQVLQTLQQIERLAIDGSFDAATMGAELEAICIRALDVPDFDQMTARLTDVEHKAADIVDRFLPPGD